MLKQGEVVQFNEHHQWGGCLGIIDEVKPRDRYLVGVPVPPRQGEEGSMPVAYIIAHENDLLRLMLSTENGLYGASDCIYPVSMITTYNPDEDEEEENGDSEEEDQ